VKENILFSSPYDKEKYEAAIHISALEEDLKIFPAGDETAIGEKGFIYILLYIYLIYM
jgi:ABC-type bacteriocin/lantibiotic exporter with double-glycine peptidase domain